MHIRVVNIIVLVLFTITMKSSFATPPSRQSLEELLEASGLNTDLKSLEENLVTSAVDAALKNKPNDEKTKSLIDILLAKNLRETFQYTLLLDEVTYFLKKQVTEEDVQEALGWYRSELGRRIVQAEAASSSSEGLTAIQNESNQLLSQPDLNRIATEVDEAIGISNAIVNMQINLQKAMFLASSAIIAPEQDISKLENMDWASINTADRATLHQPIKQQYQASFAYNMKNFSQEERVQYKDFMLKPSSIKIINATLTGIGKAIEIGGHNFMVKLINELKNPSPELQQLFSQSSPGTTTTKTTTETTTEIPIESSTENSDW
jgi:hypothetical protein